MKNRIEIFLFSIYSLFLFIDGFEVNVEYCRIECDSQCPGEVEEEEEKPEMKTEIPGFYWRDYKQNIPEDAVPLGKPGQQPRTFIGYVFDPKYDAMISAAIVEGRDYVYVSRNGTVNKRSKVLQILCSQEPQKLKWVHLGDQQLSNVVYVSGGTFYIGRRLRYAFLARANYSGEYSVGDILAINDIMEFATLDGTSETSDYFEVLYYDLNEDNSTEEREKQKQVDENSSSVSQSSQEQTMSNKSEIFPPSTPIPKFYRTLTIGSCEIVCTNIKEDEDSKKKKSENKTKKSGKHPCMYYYWKNTRFFSTSEAFVAGYDSLNKSSYIGREYVHNLGLDVGYSPDGRDNYLFGEGTAIQSSGYGKFLSTTNPEKLKWISTNADEFRTMDKSKILQAGLFYNESIPYIGRVLDGDVLSPASVRIFNDSVWAFYYYYTSYASKTFDVLSYVD